MQLVDIKDLRVSFRHHDGVVSAVRGVTLGLSKGESLGIVGESGSGKSVTFLALMRLLQAPAATIEADKLELDGSDLLNADAKALSDIRGSLVSMVFQDPMTSFDPLFTIGYQISETIQTHGNTGKKAALAQARELLAKVEIKHPDRVLKQYPHQLSGGMLQRAMIAMALSCEPRLLIADEPTTALDVTVQAQILQLITDLQQETGMSLIIITHDLGVIAETVDRVVVMYGGKVMEIGDTREIFEDPLNPYTKALIESIPGREAGKRKLIEIPGSSPNALSPPSGCPFHPRCKLADDKCASDAPNLSTFGKNRSAACWKVVQ
ncbi:MAG TPA: peptide ABC transporter ATP-binding protein [Rhodobacteraceae bacterium]|nr:peptide ABC transporter ATP-binding protein [Paracoccaceae bacterium]|tara:strand:+ start:45 stop:1010 length:966 start_codon:yes stop_codon:yes gene_type:complete